MPTTNCLAAAAPTSLTAYRARTSSVAGHALTETAGAPTLDAHALHAFYVAAADADPRGGDFHRMVAAVLSRADRVPPTDAREWSRFLGLIERHRQNPNAALNCSVLANLVGIAVFGDEADFDALSELTGLLGVERVAAVQHRAARFIEPDLTFPLTTSALRRMVAAPPHRGSGTIIESTVALLLEGVDLDRVLPVIRTRAELLGVVDGGTVLEWRHHFAVIAVNPWSPYSRHLVDLAQQAARPQVVAVIDRFTEVCREHNKEREREQVAREVRRIVYASGTTQRDFAHWIGTSPSRLSTYISGTVTPSATLMLRMARTSRLLQERDAPSPRWPGGPTELAEGAPLGRPRTHLSAV